jgi:phage major head subunit gpT-like protein
MGQFTSFDSSDIIADFYPRYEGALAGSWAPLVSFPVTSDRETEQYRWLGMAPTPRQWIGNRQEDQFLKLEQTLKNVKYEQTVAIYRDDLRRDKTGQIRARISDLAMKAATHPEVLLTNAILNGATSTFNSYDGVTFYATTHTEGSSGTQKNNLSATEIPAADVATATAPTATEMANILAQTVGYFYSYVDDKGDPYNAGAGNFLVTVGTTLLYYAALQAVSTPNLVSGATNPLLGYKLGAKSINIDVKFDPRLSANTTKIQVHRTDGAIKPFIHQVEVPMETSLLGPGSDEEFKYDRHVFGTKMIHAIGYGDWRQSIQVTLS